MRLSPALAIKEGKEGTKEGQMKESICTNREHRGSDLKNL